MRSPPDVGVIVVAAGQGRRAGGPEPKQFRAVGGVPLVQHALRPFLDHPAVGCVVVVVPADVAAAPPPWLAGLAGARVRIVAGGSERVDSVRAGLARLDADLPVVLVHDGARPFPDRAVIDAVIAEAREGRGAVAALPVTDTLKEARIDEGLGMAVVVRTVSRNSLWRAQTPQAFPRADLTRGLARIGASGAATDDASLVEPLGIPVVLVPDVARNFKVTSPADFALAEALAGPASLR